MAKAAKITRARRPAAAIDPPLSATGRSVIEAMQALHAAHGATMKIPGLDTITPGQTVEVLATAPHSIERFVQAARTHPLVKGVLILPTHIILTIAVPGDA